jgi:hypothetical protein
MLYVVLELKLSEGLSFGNFIFVLSAPVYKLSYLVKSKKNLEIELADLSLPIIGLMVSN